MDGYLVDGWGGFVDGWVDELQMDKWLNDGWMVDTQMGRWKEGRTDEVDGVEKDKKGVRERQFPYMRKLFLHIKSLVMLPSDLKDLPVQRPTLFKEDRKQIHHVFSTHYGSGTAS